MVEREIAIILPAILNISPTLFQHFYNTLSDTVKRFQICWYAIILIRYNLTFNNF